MGIERRKEERKDERKERKGVACPCILTSLGGRHETRLDASSRLRRASVGLDRQTGRKSRTD